MIGTVSGISAKAMAEALWDIEHRQTWDNDHIAEWRVEMALDESSDLHYLRTQGSFFIPGRDFIDVRRKIQFQDGSYAILFRNCDSPLIPEVTLMTHREGS